ncbi:MAG: hypothetical protein IKR59_06640 [Lachnospiraceae bacterium]|nr:hypothetical protein [Lachnospiraceae bacterium]
MNRHLKYYADHLKRDRETLKTLSGKQKRQFIWDYYKIPLIVIASVIAVALFAILVRTPKKDIAVYIVWVNAAPAQEEITYFDELLRSAGIEEKKANADVNASLTYGLPGNEASDAQTMQLLSALFGIGDMDLFAADAETFSRYSSKDAFANLEALLAPELIELAGDRLLYTVTGKGERIASGYKITANSSAAQAGYLADGSTALAGILENAQNRENAALLLGEMIKRDAGKQP